MDIISFLTENNIEHKRRGNEVYVKYCPACENPQDGDFTHLSININNELFRCKKCNNAGHIWKYALDIGIVIKKNSEKKYKMPAINKELFVSAGEYKFFEWYQEKKGIDKNILLEYQIGLFKQNNKTYIVYHYFNEKKILINRKYRNLQDKKDMFCEKEAQQIYYGLDKINFTVKDLYITEGEDDCHALRQLGFNNVVSVPSGASNYTPDMDRINNLFDKIYLLFDCDPVGQAGAELFAKKAGYHKCLNVLLPYKDVRDCLINGLTRDHIKDYCDNADVFEMEEIIKAIDIYKTYQMAPSVNISEKAVNKFFGGIRLGEMTMVTGHSGAGKTTAMLNFTHWAIKENIPVMFMSFENTYRNVLDKLVQIMSGLSIYKANSLGYIERIMPDNNFMGYVNALNNYPLYFLNNKIRNGYYDVKAIEEICKYATKFYNVKLFVIDNLHYILKIHNDKNKTHEIDEYIRHISTIAKETDSHILLIAHPYKSENAETGKLAKLNLYCIKGSSTVVQEASNFIIIEKSSCDNFSKWRMLKSREWRTGEISFNVKENKNTYEVVNSLDAFKLGNQNDNSVETGF
jgi:twinkle protein